MSKSAANTRNCLPYRVGLAGLTALLLGDASVQATTIKPQNRLNQLKSLTDVMKTLPGKDAEADAKKMLAVVRSKTVFSESGIKGTSVWARWKDGPVVTLNMIPNVVVRTAAGTIQAAETQNTVSAEPAAAAQATTQEAEPLYDEGEAATANRTAAASNDKLNVPDAAVARVLSTFPDTVRHAGKLAEALADSRIKYTISSRDAALGNLRSTVKGDGFFYIDAHADTAKVDGVEMCFFQTSTPVALDTLGKPVVNEDLEAVRAVAMSKIEKVMDAKGNLIETKVYTNYGIGPRWIRHYGWKFSRNSLVWVNACHSANPALRKAMLDAGASGYLGWTNSVRNMRAVDAAHFLLDRLMGANKLRGMSGSFPPEDIKQRSFPIATLIPELAKKGLDRDVTSDGPAQLTFVRRTGNGDFGLLAPSIRRMKVDEENKEILFTGFFGADPKDNGYVQIEDTKLKVKKWEPRRITCELPQYGAGSSGLAEVVVREHRSNIVPLTEWNGRVDYELKALGTLKEVFGFPVRFRHDVHQFRDVPGEQPHGDKSPEAQLFFATKYNKNGTELLGTFTGSGTGTVSVGHCGSVMKWEGKSTLVNSVFGSNEDQTHYWFIGYLNADTREMKSFQSGVGWTKITVHATAPCDPTPTTAESSAVTYSNLDKPEHYSTAGSGYTFPADTLPQSGHTPYHGAFPKATSIWKWSAMTASTPPVTPLPDGWAS